MVLRVNLLKNYSKTDTIYTILAPSGIADFISRLFLAIISANLDQDQYAKS